MSESDNVEVPEIDELDAQLKALEDAERAIDRAYTTGKAERAKITQMAQLDAAEAVAMAGIAMEADERADEAMRISVIAERSGDRERAKAGLTGMAQIYGKYNTSPKDKLMLDLSYIEHFSIWLDLKLMFRTVLVLFTPEESTEAFEEDQSGAAETAAEAYPDEDTEENAAEEARDE